MEPGLAEASQLFRVLGNESRLALLRIVEREPLTVGALVEASGLSQPLVSQHLKMLRQAGLVASEREGREVRYRVADGHVVHLVADALVHVREPSRAPARDEPSPDEREEMA